MSVWSLQDLVEALGQTPLRRHAGPSAEVVVRGGASIDSRTLQSGQLFVCLRGENTDGHRFVADAAARGAGAILIEEQALLSGAVDLPPPEDPCVFFSVESGEAALQDLARFHRARLSIPVFGVTGSNGKTSTKELLQGLLNATALAPAFATVGNLNNHLGVPLSILSIDDRYRSAVIEMGMNHAGEIAALTGIARPHHAIITNIGPAHIENFADIDGIVEAKLEILQGMSAGGCLAYHAGSRGVERARTLCARTGTRLLLFDLDQVAATGDGSATATDLRLGLDGLIFRWAELDRVVQAPAFAHAAMAQNLIGAMALLHAAGLDADTLVQAAEQVRVQSARRFEMIRLPRPGRPEQLLVDDCYNANPASFISALQSLRRLLPEGNLAVFAGEMGEQGAFGPEGHRQVGAAAGELGYALCAIAGGSLSDHIARGFAQEARLIRAPDSAALAALLPSLNLVDFDGILVKGSRSARMELVSDPLRKLSYV